MHFRRSLLCLSISAVLPLCAFAAENNNEEDVQFNEQFLYNTGASIDISRFSKGNPVIAGTYKVKMIVNGKPSVTTVLLFKENGTPRATPCITPKLLTQANVTTEQLKHPEGDSADTCVSMPDAYPGSRVAYDPSTQELDLSIPQAFVIQRPAGFVDPSLWEDGIPVAMLSWDLNGWHADMPDSSTDTAYAGLRYGANLGPWRLRARGNLNWDQDSGTHYASQDIYLQRDITPLKAQFIAGDSYTRGDAFDSISLRGARLYNDDRMLPNGISTYAPVIRGVANSNAKVTIAQSGNTIYETSVPPGPFEITDLSTTGYGSDLIVTVEETDGSKRSFSVAYSSVAQMLRPGYSRWDVGVGELRDDSLRDKPKVGYATGYYGLTNTFTGYAGLEYTDSDFYATLLGIAMNTGVGAFALDVTHSDARIDGLRHLTGESYRISYSKLMEATNTSFNVAAYRFSTSDYLSLNDAASLTNEIKYRDRERNPERNNSDVYQTFQRMKNQIQVNISQPLNIADLDLGSLYVNSTWQDYWNESSSSAQYSVGHSHSLSWGSYSLTVQRTYNEFGEKDDSVYLNLTIPFDTLMGNSKRAGGFSSLTTGIGSDLKGGSSFNASANGNTEDNRFSYSITESTTRYDDTLNQLSGYGSYNGPHGPLSLSVSASDDGTRQYSASYSGGMVLHSGGVTLAPGSISESDTLALIKAEGAEGARVSIGNGEIGASGYALMPYLSAYRENSVGLDISEMHSDVEVKNTRSTTVPRSGAVVLVNFETDQGRSVLMELMRDDGGFIPLGADVQTDQGVSVGSVGQAGQAWIRGIEDKGTLNIVWGNEPGTSCTVSYHIPPDAKKIGPTTLLTGQTCHVTAL
ncbi:outer membrane usher protein [Enterobacter cloacae]|uniref:outer membrane usher protein n=1 Tax=Enterobacter cloacae TaxID=550 RepID=UPI00300E8167